MTRPDIDPHTAFDRPLFADLPGDIGVSFEFFPPKTANMEERMWQAVEMLEPLAPDFVSVTYGAGGTTRDRTHAIVAQLAQRGLPAAAHLTCVDASRAEVDAVAEQYWAAGVRHIVALRGDVANPDGSPGAPFAPHADGYENAAALVAGLKRIAPFEISVAAYPECHPDSHDEAADIDNLKRKIDAGATRAITQFFFTPDAFLRWRDAIDAAGITVPVIAGVLPVSNVAQTRKFAAACNAVIPSWMDGLFEGLDERPQARRLVAATIAAEFCRRLYAGGVRDFHFYTLNRADLAYAVCHMLGARPKGTQIRSEAA